MLNILGMLMKYYWDNENPHFDFKTGIFQLYYLQGQISLLKQGSGVKACLAFGRKLIGLI